MKADVVKGKGSISVKLSLTDEEKNIKAKEETRLLGALPKSLVKAIQELQSQAEKGGATLKVKL